MYCCSFCWGGSNGGEAETREAAVCERREREKPASSIEHERERLGWRYPCCGVASIGRRLAGNSRPSVAAAAVVVEHQQTSSHTAAFSPLTHTHTHGHAVCFETVIRFSPSSTSTPGPSVTRHPCFGIFFVYNTDRKPVEDNTHIPTNHIKPACYLCAIIDGIIDVSEEEAVNVSTRASAGSRVHIIILLSATQLVIRKPHHIDSSIDI